MDTSPTRRGAGRPLATTRQAVERAALTLMLRDGYARVSVEDIAREAGIGRSTFFRYFKSKPGVVWAAFDQTIVWLDEALEANGGRPDVLDSVREGVVSSTRSAIHASDVWLERFRLLDSSPELRSEANEHWERWASSIATFVARRTNRSPDDWFPLALAGATKGTFLAELRNWLNTDDQRDEVLSRLDGNLAKLFAALASLQ